MYSIGEFSQISGLTVKALRFYHEQGLLAPTHIDEQSGYRYYDASKVAPARLIGQLRRFEFSLDDIRDVLAASVEGEDTSSALERQQQVLAQKAKHYRQLHKQLQKFLAEQREETTMTHKTFTIEEKQLEPLLVAGIRMRGKYSDCGKAFGQLGHKCGRWICGQPVILYYDGEYKEEDADFEPCMPIRKELDTPGVSVRMLPGGTCLSLMHEGPYDSLGKSYAALIEHTHQQHYEIVLPTREVCWKGPGMILRGNPKKYLTEIQFLVKK